MNILDVSDRHSADREGPDHRLSTGARRSQTLGRSHLLPPPRRGRSRLLSRRRFHQGLSRRRQVRPAGKSVVNDILSDISPSSPRKEDAAVGAPDNRAILSAPLGPSSKGSREMGLTMSDHRTRHGRHRAVTGPAKAPWSVAGPPGANRAPLEVPGNRRFGANPPRSP